MRTTHANQRKAPPRELTGIASLMPRHMPRRMPRAKRRQPDYRRRAAEGATDGACRREGRRRADPGRARGSGAASDVRPCAPQPVLKHTSSLVRKVGRTGSCLALTFKVKNGQWRVEGQRTLTSNFGSWTREVGGAQSPQSHVRAPRQEPKVCCAKSYQSHRL